MRRDTLNVLEHVLTAVQHVADDTAGMTFEAFECDRRARQLVERNVEIIGKAVNRLRKHDPSVAVQISSHNQIVALRNALMISLIEKHRAKLYALCRQYGVLRLDLFGSAATGAFDAETSDFDFIATFANTDKPGYADCYLGFAEVLEAHFGRSVDLRTERSIRNPYFREAVEATRQPV